MNDNDLFAGIGRLYDNFARLARHDFVLVAYTPDSRRYAAASRVYLEERGIAHVCVPMRPLHDPGLANRLLEALPAPESFRGNFIAVSLEAETMSHVPEFTALLTRYGQARSKVLRIISASEEFFDAGLRLDPDHMEALNATMLAHLEGVTSFTATSASGSELQITLDQDAYDWVSNRGKLRPGAFTILPAGEIATYPARVDGVLVADGAVNTNFIAPVDMRLAEHPATLTVENSQLVDISCGRKDMLDLLKGAFDTIANASRVGEIGFGTNRGLVDFVPQNTHLNERFPGIHLGFGQHNQDPTRVAYASATHIDLVTNGGTLHLPDRDVDLRTFEVMPEAKHPALMRDEDVVGDCCSSGCTIIPVPSLAGAPRS